MAELVTLGGSGALFVGEDKEIRMHVKDDAGASIDITGWLIKFVVRRSDASADPAVLDKTATVSGTYAVTANPQRAVVSLTDTDMGISRGSYRYSFKRTDDGSETILAYGPFLVERATQI